MESNYFKNLNQTTKQYFQILSSEIPSFLYDYVETPEMQKQAGITTSCGTVYSRMFEGRKRYSSLEHSIATALIVWHFTKNKKQTLAALFHDISTPAFKHCVDFMNGDYENQESTEELTSKIISNSKEIMSLLDKDNIKLEEISDYHKYPIADNDTPKLSADRLEYTLSNGLGVIKPLWDLQTVKEIYEDIEVQKNEEGIEELGFKTIEIAELFVKNMSKLSMEYTANDVKFSMEFLANIMKKMITRNDITIKDLYNLSETEVIQKIENCNDDNISNCFQSWENATQINESDTPVENKYCVSVKAKTRYIVPLIEIQNDFVRVSQVSEVAKQNIEECLQYKTKKYAYMDFQF